MGDISEILHELHAATESAQKAADDFVRRLEGVVESLKPLRSSLRPSARPKIDNGKNGLPSIVPK
jgi:hypothetical protein